MHKYIDLELKSYLKMLREVLTNQRCWLALIAAIVDRLSDNGSSTHYLHVVGGGSNTRSWWHPHQLFKEVVYPVMGGMY